MNLAGLSDGVPQCKQSYGWKQQQDNNNSIEIRGPLASTKEHQYFLHIAWASSFPHFVTESVPLSVVCLSVCLLILSVCSDCHMLILSVSLPPFFLFLLSFSSLFLFLPSFFFFLLSFYSIFLFGSAFSEPKVQTGLDFRVLCCLSVVCTPSPPNETICSRIQNFFKFGM